MVGKNKNLIWDQSPFPLCDLQSIAAIVSAQSMFPGERISWEHLSDGS